MTTGRVRGAERGSRERRQVWEERWREQEGSSFVWHLDEVPAELSRLLEELEMPPGAALDLGCGAGVSTDYLAQRFQPTVGLDIAQGAVAEARELTRRQDHRATFVVADAAVLPFRDRRFAFVFDRGCLQNMPRAAWASYFAEAERLLTPGGTLQVLCSKGARRELPPLLSAHGLRVRAKRLLGRGGAGGGPQFLSHALFRSLAPPSLAVIVMEDFPFTTTGGHHRMFTHAVFRRR